MVEKTIFPYRVKSLSKAGGNKVDVELEYFNPRLASAPDDVEQLSREEANTLGLPTDIRVTHVISPGGFYPLLGHVVGVTFVYENCICYDDAGNQESVEFVLVKKQQLLHS